MSTGHGNVHGGFARESAGCSSERNAGRRAGAEDLRAGSGGGGLCAVGVEQASARTASGRRGRIAPDAFHALGHEAALPEAAGQASQAAVLFADESGWRVDGKTHWLWCFTTRDLTYYMIDRSRGSPALLKFFIEEFSGTLVTDFWAAYNAVACALRQTCLVHLLRELEHTEKYKSPGKHWPTFAKKLRRLLADAVRL